MDCLLLSFGHFHQVDSDISHCFLARDFSFYKSPKHLFAPQLAQPGLNRGRQHLGFRAMGFANQVIKVFACCGHDESLN